MMLNFGSLINAVQSNCHISDARYAGHFSMCTFLMKMREYYRWEHELPFSGTLPREELGQWLAERERTWQRIGSANYERLPLNRGLVDPFDYESANEELLPRGYVYSSGYGIFHKPHFFLGQLTGRVYRDGLTVLISSCEYARDLVAPPAMLLGNTVFVRLDAIRRFLWERLEEWRWRKQPDLPMARAVACYDVAEDIERLLDRMTANETEAIIRHEIGEARAGELLGAEWEKMIDCFADPRLELVARAVRDHLADCLSTLPALLEGPNEASLHFYFANLTGMRKALFPEAVEAYRRWVEEKDISALKALPREGARHWRDTACGILAAFRRGPDRARARIERLAARRLR